MPLPNNCSSEGLKGVWIPSPSKTLWSNLVNLAIDPCPPPHCFASTLVSLSSSITVADTGMYCSMFDEIVAALLLLDVAVDFAGALGGQHEAVHLADLVVGLAELVRDLAASTTGKDDALSEGSAGGEHVGRVGLAELPFLGEALAAAGVGFHAVAVPVLAGI